MVSSEDVKNLTVTEGGSITLPDPVVGLGFLLYEGSIVAMVTDKKIQIYREIYKDKLLWNNSTGLFTITRLQRNDSGIYSIDSQTGKEFVTSYKITVYGESHFLCQLFDHCIGANSILHIWGLSSSYVTSSFV